MLCFVLHTITVRNESMYKKIDTEKYIISYLNDHNIVNLYTQHINIIKPIQLE